MATEFPMPKLGLTMTEGTVVEWLVPSGTAVSDGTAVLRIETDKTETEVEINGDGILHAVAQVGDTIECGGLIGWLLTEGEAPPAPPTPVAAGPAAVPSVAASQRAMPQASASASASVPGRADGRLFASPNARRVAAERGVALASVRGTGPGGRIVSEDVLAAPIRSEAAALIAAPLRVGGAGVPATAAARQLADLLGVDLAEVPYDPQDGRVTRDAVALHVRTLLRTAAAPVATSPLPPPAPTIASAGSPPAPLAQTPTRTVRMSGMRGTIAKRMHASLQEMAQLTLTMDADVGAVLADQARRSATTGSAPGFTAYVIAAAARALASHPIVNSQIHGNDIAVLPDIHVGMAVALDNGLIVPVIRHADQCTLTELGAESARLAAAARAGSLTPDEAAGGTFSVTALGMYGVDTFTPVINPPNAAILGVGRFRDDLTLVDGAVVAVKRLTLSLTWDHRVLDGAPAAAFCQTVAANLSGDWSVV